MTSAMMRMKLQGKRIVRVGAGRSEPEEITEQMSKLDMVIYNFRKKNA